MPSFLAHSGGVSDAKVYRSVVSENENMIEVIKEEDIIGIMEITLDAQSERIRPDDSKEFCALWYFCARRSGNLGVKIAVLDIAHKF